MSTAERCHTQSDCGGGTPHILHASLSSRPDSVFDRFLLFSASHEKHLFGKSERVPKTALPHLGTSVAIPRYGRVNTTVGSNQYLGMLGSIRA